MAIFKVEQRMRTVTIYNENNRILFSKDLGTGYNTSDVGLEGYTDTVVMIRMPTIQGIRLITFDENGKQIKIEPLRRR
jgi:hypothetical protein